MDNDIFYQNQKAVEMKIEEMTIQSVIDAVRCGLISKSQDYIVIRDWTSSSIRNSLIVGINCSTIGRYGNNDLEPLLQPSIVTR